MPAWPHLIDRPLLIILQAAVCTPGRMIDLIKMKACNMKRTTYLVSRRGSWQRVQVAGRAGRQGACHVKCATCLVRGETFVIRVLPSEPITTSPTNKHQPTNQTAKQLLKKLFTGTPRVSHSGRSNQQPTVKQLADLPCFLSTGV